MKRRQRSWRSPERKPVWEKSNITGVVWSVPSWEIAEAVIPEIEQKMDQDQVGCGPEISLYAFFTTNHKEGSCVVLIGLGTMFNPNFLAVCEGCIQRHSGSRLPESQRTRELMHKVHIQWRKERKQERKEIRELMRSVSTGIA